MLHVQDRQSGSGRRTCACCGIRAVKGVPGPDQETVWPNRCTEPSTMPCNSVNGRPESCWATPDYDYLYGFPPATPPVHTYTRKRPLSDAPQPPCKTMFRERPQAETYMTPSAPAAPHTTVPPATYAPPCYAYTHPPPDSLLCYPQPYLCMQPTTYACAPQPQHHVAYHTPPPPAPASPPCTTSRTATFRSRGTSPPAALGKKPQLLTALDVLSADTPPPPLVRTNSVLDVWGLLNELTPSCSSAMSSSSSSTVGCEGGFVGVDGAGWVPHEGFAWGEDDRLTQAGGPWGGGGRIAMPGELLA